MWSIDVRYFEATLDVVVYARHCTPAVVTSLLLICREHSAVFPDSRQGYKNTLHRPCVRIVSVNDTSMRQSYGNGGGVCKI